MPPVRQLEKVTVNLIPRASAALLLAVDLTGDTKTDTINRALQFYAWAMWLDSQGKDLLIRDMNGLTQKVLLTYGRLEDWNGPPKAPTA